MERYAIEQRVLFIKTHYEHGERVAVTVSRKLRTILGHREAPIAATIMRLVEKFEETANIKSPERKRYPKGRIVKFPKFSLIRPKMVENL